MMIVRRCSPPRVAARATIVAPLILLILEGFLVAPVALATATSSSASPVTEEQNLEQVWTGLVGRRGILEEKSCGYVLTLSSPTQSGNAVVKAVHDDHVVLVVDRDQTKLEYVVPLAQITLRSSTK